MTGTKEIGKEPPALDVVEEAIVLLKRAGASAFGVYAAGTFGFLWALLYFWAYMSRNARAGSGLTELSLLLALAFAAMKTCHALFFRRLIGVLERTDPRPPSPGLLLKTFLAQSLIQPIGLLTVPFALALTFPFPFVAAFFQNAHWVREGEGFTEWMSRSYKLAGLWPRQNVQAHLFLAGFGPCVILNVVSALVAAPSLLKTLFGVETVFTRSSAAYVNSTFFLMALALSWALLDPFVKAIHAWRCFHGLARRTGMDLRLALEGFPGPARAKPVPAPFLALALTIGLAAISTWGNPQHTHGARALAEASTKVAAETAKRPAAETATPVPSVSPEVLKALLKEEIAESRYGWRLPRERSSEEADTWLMHQSKKAAHAIARLARKVRGLWLRFSDWFNGLFQDRKETASPSAKADPSPLPTRILVAGLSALFACAIAAFLLRRFRSVPETVPIPIRPAPKAPDAASEDAKADDFPEDEWMRLMESLRAEGQERLAMRALFLATLSALSRKGWVTIARHKGNRDYQREVGTRARRNPGVDECFRDTCLRFDRIWYGLHEVTGEDWEASRANFAKVRADAD